MAIKYYTIKTMTVNTVGDRILYKMIMISETNSRSCTICIYNLLQLCKNTYTENIKLKK